MARVHLVLGVLEAYMLHLSHGSFKECMVTPQGTSWECDRLYDQISWDPISMGM
jgi:hypothetical protein